jgi:hypothetical protein
LLRETQTRSPIVPYEVHQILIGHCANFALHRYVHPFSNITPT